MIDWLNEESIPQKSGDETVWVLGVGNTGKTCMVETGGEKLHLTYGGVRLAELESVGGIFHWCDMLGVRLTDASGLRFMFESRSSWSEIFDPEDQDEIPY